MDSRLGNRKRPSKKGRWVPLRGDSIVKPKLNEPTIDASNGLKVRSKYEKQVIEFFIRNNIEYKYEPLILLHGRQFRPDFYLPKQNLFIEICGYNHMPQYRLRIARKKQLYSKYDLNAMFINYNGKGSLEKLINESLKLHGIKIA